MAETTPVDFEAEYDNRANVPEHPAIMAGWERDAAAYRRERASRSELSLRYGPHARQLIDVFHPAGPDGAAPMVVFIHGGYWRSLEPGLFSHLARGANARGLAVALPGYRLCPEVSVAYIIEDVRSACLFLHRRYGRPLVACGHSAGGHLAAALAATDWTGMGPNVPDNLVRTALAVSGIFDLRPLLHTSVNETLGLTATSAERVSPALRAAPPDAVLEAWVGEAETGEYHRQSRTVAERWATTGARIKLQLVEGANHFTAPAPLFHPNSALTEALVGLCGAAAQA